MGDLHRFLENLVLHGLLAEHALQVADLLHGLSQLGSRDDRLPCPDGSEVAFLIKLAPLEHLIVVHIVLTRHGGHRTTGLEGFPHDGQLLLDAEPASLLWMGQHIDPLDFGHGFEHGFKTTA